jgi:hypothetical protein
MVRRASRFKSLLAAASAELGTSRKPLPRLKTELLGFASWPNVPIGKIILVPGGRYLIILGENQPIQVYDLAQYYMDGTPTSPISSFVLPHRFLIIYAAASALAGTEASCVRLLLHEFGETQ